MLTKHSLQRAAHSLDFEYHTKTQQPSRASTRESQTGLEFDRSTMAESPGYVRSDVV
jgi:hypothetical protein